MATRYNYTGGIVTNGLVLNLDAAKTDSYPGTGTTWRDLSGFGNNGTLTNGPTFSGIGKQASIVFDGVDDYYNIPTSITDTMNVINIWVKMLSTSVCPILYYGSDIFNSNSWTWGIAVFPSSTHGFNEAPLNYPTTALYTESITTNIWKNFTLVRNDSGNVRLYKNGILVGSKIGAGTTALRDSSDRLYIAKAGTTYGNFEISQVLIYNRALSAQEITQNFNALRGRYGI